MIHSFRFFDSIDLPGVSHGYPASFDLSFDFHTSSSSYVKLTLNDGATPSTSRLTAIAFHSYRRKRGAELLAGWKILCAQERKAGQ